MRRFYFFPLLLIAALLVWGGFATPALGAEETHATTEEHHVPLKPDVLFEVGQFAVTNSMLVTWIVAIAIIVFAQAATRNIKAVPSGKKYFWEWLVEGIYKFLESIIGTDLVRRTFWFFATLFIFILFVNWFGLVPGIGTIGWGHFDSANNTFIVDRPLLRGGN